MPERKFLDIENFKLYPHEKTLGKSDSIPNKKGIYAWYIDFSKFKNFNTVEEFSKKLELLDQLITTDTLKGSVKSYFRHYHVNLEENRLFLDRYFVEESNDELIFGDKIKQLSLEDCRKMMELLANFSILVNPLYVGISTSLQSRWEQHRKAFFSIKQMEENNEDSETIAEYAYKTFGGRVAVKGFNWEYLIFACVEKDIDRRLINETEYLINRFYNPLFGRR